VDEYTDSFGNLCQRLIAPPGSFKVRTSATVDAAEHIDVQPGAPFTLIEELPDDAYQFLLPSRYCQSDMLEEKALEVVGEATPGYDQVEAIRAWIHANIDYRSGSSDVSTSALETLERRAGVCRDFVHLGVALCRSLNMPARMVVGYLYRLQPMDLHAWFEAFVGGRWYSFDATQPEPRGGRIAIGYGRDAADVAMATHFGPATITDMRVWVEKANEA
jgi:transglutaminase-like putative cysteine protease